MTKTLADMTPEQRANCVGMWANVDTERYAAVIVRTYAADDVDYAQMLCPELNDYYTSSLATITPRFDLPRAWAPDGTPAAGEWETCDSTDIFLDGIGTPTGHAYSKTTRRFVTEWETVPNA